MSNWSLNLILSPISDLSRRLYECVDSGVDVPDVLSLFGMGSFSLINMPVSLFKSKFKDARSSLFGLVSVVGGAPLSDDIFAPLFGDASVDVGMAGAPLSLVTVLAPSLGGRDVAVAVATLSDDATVGLVVAGAPFSVMIGASLSGVESDCGGE